MKRKNIKLVTVSALALSAFRALPAQAQIIITCSQGFQVGKHAACGNGSITVNPSGGTSPSGCIVTIIPPAPAKCILKTTAIGLTKNVVVTLKKTQFFLNGTGGGMVKIDKLVMLPTSKATPKTNYTFTPTEVSNKVMFGVGGRINFSSAQALGNYTGTLQVTATILP